MLISIVQVLSKTEARDFRAQLDAAAWDDGAATAGTLAKSVKRNQQITDGSELCQRLGQHILRRLRSTPLFISAALTRTIYPPKFNRYADGGTYGGHFMIYGNGDDDITWGRMILVGPREAIGRLTE